MNSNKAMQGRNSLDKYIRDIEQKGYDHFRALATDPHVDYNYDKIDTSSIPTIKDYVLLTHIKYTSIQLKQFAKHYKLKMAGTKHELTLRIFMHLYLRKHSTVVQRIFRGWMHRRFWREMHGPAYMRRDLCVNHTDFLSMEDIKTIPVSQFFSYKDVDGFVYGFDSISLHNLIKNAGSSSKLLNPYNRNIIQPAILDKFDNLLRVSDALNMGITTEINNDGINMTVDQILSLRVLDLFQNMNALGNYSDTVWFTSLNKIKLLRLMRELFDIWNYRLQISRQTKCMICPPLGNPLRFCDYHALREEENEVVIRSNILSVLESMVNTGVDRDHKCLGAYYVLGALTLVNDSAAAALPWLYQSVAY